MLVIKKGTYATMIDYGTAWANLKVNYLWEICMRFWQGDEGANWTVLEDEHDDEQGKVISSTCYLILYISGRLLFPRR